MYTISIVSESKNGTHFFKANKYITIDINKFCTRDQGSAIPAATSFKILLWSTVCGIALRLHKKACVHLLTTPGTSSFTALSLTSETSSAESLSVWAPTKPKPESHHSRWWPYAERRTARSCTICSEQSFWTEWRGSCSCPTCNGLYCPRSTLKSLSWMQRGKPDLSNSGINRDPTRTESCWL